MANRQQFTLQFNADVRQAKREFEALSKILTDISTMHLKTPIEDSAIKKASAAAQELNRHLQSAVNVDTGKLNLNAFSRSLEQANTSISELSASLLEAGQIGQDAFLRLTSSIAQTEVPLRRTSSLLREWGTTLKNTVKWELSSSIVHGLESALAGAVSYAKNLNGSLNDIRIVTGASVEDMAKFADQANRAAKALSTTTKEYADASLIYYQQGDSAEEAAKKAAITIKAANASFGTSAQEMSEYLTAVWNSYQVGADELERYVDIMAALGAKTATSLEEIATSMQKVAATSNAVGVSMEQVSSIIATVSSVTRESAESIGTSYKTIFARIGDLKLGGADEDGIGLGQVSSALESIGVEILDASGNLRDMGDIITDLGNKWQTMSEAQKVATAQVVAGKRQYTQLMALFESWDMYNANLNIAGGAEGSLQEMADIAAESWQAAAKRVTASLESIYSTLLNDEGIVKLLNFLDKLIEASGGIIQGYGGVAGIVAGIGGAMAKYFSADIAATATKGINNLKEAFSNAGTEQERFLQTSQQTRAALIELAERTDITEGTRQQLQIDMSVMEQKEQLLRNQKLLTDDQRKSIEGLIQAYHQEASAIAEVQAQLDKQKQQQENNRTDLKNSILKDEMSRVAGRTGSNMNEMTRQDLLALKELANETFVKDSLAVPITFTMKGAEDKLIADIQGALTQINSSISDSLPGLDTLFDESLDSLTFDKLENSVISFTQKLGESQGILTQMRTIGGDFGETFLEANKNVDELKKDLNEYIQSFEQLTGQSGFATQLRQQLTESISTDELKDIFVRLQNEFKTFNTTLNPITEQLQQTFLDMLPDDELKERARRMFQELEQTARDHEAATERNARAIQQAYEQMAEKIEQQFSKMSRSIQQWVNFAANVSQVIGTIESLKSTIDTLSNPDTTGLEKLSAVMGFLVSLTQSAQATLEIATSVRLAYNWVLKQSNKLLSENTKETVENAAAQQLSNSQVLKAVAGIAGKNLGQIFMSKFVGVISSGGWIALVLAALYGIVKGANALYDNYIQERLEKDEKAAKKQAAVLNKVDTMKQHYSDLKSIIDDVSLSYEEKLRLINEIANQYGIQIDAVDVLTNSYDELYNAMLKVAGETAQEVAHAASEAATIQKEAMRTQGLINGFYVEDEGFRVEDNNYANYEHYQQMNPGSAQLSEVDFYEAALGQILKIDSTGMDPDAIDMGKLADEVGGSLTEFFQQALNNNYTGEIHDGSEIAKFFAQMSIAPQGLDFGRSTTWLESGLSTEDTDYNWDWFKDLVQKNSDLQGILHEHGYSIDGENGVRVNAGFLENADPTNLYNALNEYVTRSSSYQDTTEIQKFMRYLNERLMPGWENVQRLESLGNSHMDLANVYNSIIQSKGELTAESLLSMIDENDAKDSMSMIISELSNSAIASEAAEVLSSAMRLAKDDSYEAVADILSIIPKEFQTQKGMSLIDEADLVDERRNRGSFSSKAYDRISRQLALEEKMAAQTTFSGAQELLTKTEAYTGAEITQLKTLFDEYDTVVEEFFNDVSAEEFAMLSASTREAMYTALMNSYQQDLDGLEEYANDLAERATAARETYEEYTSKWTAAGINGSLSYAQVDSETGAITTTEGAVIQDWNSAQNYRAELEQGIIELEAAINNADEQGEAFDLEAAKANLSAMKLQYQDLTRLMQEGLQYSDDLTYALDEEARVTERIYELRLMLDQLQKSEKFQYAEMMTGALESRNLSDSELSWLAQYNPDAFENYQTMNDEEWAEFAQSEAQKAFTELETLYEKDAGYVEYLNQLKANSATEYYNLIKSRAQEAYQLEEERYNSQIENLNEQAKMMASTLTAESLTAEQKAMLGEDWANKDANERLTDYLNILSEIEQAQKELNKLRTPQETLRDSFEENISSAEELLNLINDISDIGTKNVALTAYDEWVASGSKNIKDFYNIYEKLAKDTNDQIEKDSLITIAKLRDEATNAIEAILNLERDAAQKAADAWRTAFDNISKWRLSLTEGKSLAEIMAGDPEAVYQAFLASGFSSMDEFAKEFMRPGSKKLLDRYSNPEPLSIVTALESAGLGIFMNDSGQIYKSLEAAYSAHLAKTGASHNDENWANFQAAYNEALGILDLEMNAEWDEASVAVSNWADAVRYSQAALEAQTEEQRLVAERDKGLDELQQQQELVRQALENGIDSLLPSQQAEVQELLTTYGSLENANLNLGIKMDELANACARAIESVWTLGGMSQIGDTDYYFDSSKPIETTTYHAENEDIANIYKDNIDTGLQEDGTYIETDVIQGEDGTYYVAKNVYDAQTYNGLQENRGIEPAEINSDNTREAELYQIDYDLSQSESQFDALSKISDPELSAEEYAESLDELLEAYEGIAEAEEIIAELKDGTMDLTEANEELASITMKTGRNVAKMTDEQYDQWKQMLKNNDVTIEGYDSLEEYLDEQDHARSIYKQTSSSLEKVTDEMQNSQEATNEFAQAWNDASDAWIDADQDGFLDLSEYQAGVSELTNWLGQVLPEEFRGAAEMLSLVMTQFGGDWNQAIAAGFDQTIGAFNDSTVRLLEAMGLNADQILALQEQTKIALQESANIGDINFLSMIADMDVDPTAFDAMIEAINKAMAAIYAQAAEKGIILDPPTWTPIDTMAKHGIGPHGGGKRSSGGGGSNASVPQRAPSSSGGGGSGGSSPKEETPKEKKVEEYLEAEDEIERYHYITNQLNRTQEALEQIDALKDRAWGKDHIDQIDAEIKKLKENIEEQQKYRDEIASYLAQDRQAVVSLGAQLDEEGNISNYEEVMNNIIAQYNAAVDAYNASAQEKGDDLALEDAKERYDKAKEAIEQYVETLELQGEAYAELLDLQNQISEAALEKVQYKLELVVDLNEADIELLEYYQDLFEDDLTKSDDLLRNMTSQAKQQGESLATLLDAYRELQTLYETGNLNEADFVEGMEELRDQALDYASALQELKTEIVEVYADALDLANEEVENHIDKISHASEVMSNYIEIMGLLGQGTNYNDLAKFYNAQYNMNLQMIASQKDWLDQLLAEEEYYKNQITLTELEQEQYEALQDSIIEAREALLSSTQNALQGVEEAFTNTIQGIFKELDNALAGAAGSLSNLADYYSYYQEADSRYITTAKELYEVSKLNRNIEDSIQDVSSEAAKQRLKTLQEEIKLLSEKNDLTEYDIELLNLQYELAKAQNALEEAQDAKAMVRLTRDSDGNMAYQYTADQSKIDAAQQQYEDVLQRINELTANRASEMEQLFLTTEQQYLQMAQEILTDTTLTSEEKAKRLEEIFARYTETMAYIQEQYTNATGSLLQNQGSIVENYGQNLVNTAGKTQTQLNSILGEMIHNMDEQIKLFDEYVNTQGLGSLKDYEDKIAQIMKDSGLNSDSMTDSIKDFADLSAAAGDAIEDVMDKFSGTLDNLHSATNEWDAHLAVLENVQSAYENIATSAQDAIRTLSGFNTSNTVGSLFGNSMSNEEWLKQQAIAYEQFNQQTSNDAMTDINSLAFYDSLQSLLNTDLQNLLSFNLSSGSVGGGFTTSNPIEQHIDINADFPGVADANEIKSAFNDLINLATQYAYSTDKD